MLGPAAVSVVTGTHEAVYDWLSAAVFRRAFSQPLTGTARLAVADLGGASTQLALPVEWADYDAAPTHVQTLTATAPPTPTLALHAVSRLGWGVYQAFHRLLGDAQAEAAPCLYPGDELPAGASGTLVRGKGSWDGCLQLLRRRLLPSLLDPRTAPPAPPAAALRSVAEVVLVDTFAKIAFGAERAAALTGAALPPLHRCAVASAVAAAATAGAVADDARAGWRRKGAKRWSWARLRLRRWVGAYARASRPCAPALTGEAAPAAAPCAPRPRRCCASSWRTCRCGRALTRVTLAALMCCRCHDCCRPCLPLLSAAAACRCAVPTLSAPSSSSSSAAAVV